MYRRILMTATLLASSISVQAATIAFDPMQDSANLGEIFTLDVMALDFPATVGGGANLYFDASVVHVVAVNIDTDMWDFGPTGVNEGTIDNNAGTVTGIMMTAFPGVPAGDFVAFSIEFQAVGVGTSALTLTEYLLNPWADDIGNAINPTYIAGEVNISAVPLPAAAWLLLSGLGCFGLVRRKRS